MPIMSLPDTIKYVILQLSSHSEFTNTFVNLGFQGIAFWTVTIKSPVDAPKATKVEDVNSVLQDILAIL